MTQVFFSFIYYGGRGRDRGRDRIVFGFILVTAYAIRAYHH